MIIHAKLKGYLATLLVNLGFFFSFILLFVVAVYEEKFNLLTLQDDD